MDPKGHWAQTVSDRDLMRTRERGNHSEPLNRCLCSRELTMVEWLISRYQARPSVNNIAAAAWKDTQVNESR